MKITLPVLVAVVAGCLLGVPATASAALTTSASANTLTVFSNSPTEENQVAFAVDDDQGLVFTDNAAGVAAGFCPVLSDEIVCGNSLDGIKHFRVELGGGDDSYLIFDPRLIAIPRVRVIAGAGEDQVFSLAPVDVSLGPGNDIASLGLVADKADGGSGNDKIVGGTGDDLLKGGSGNDELNGGASEQTSSGFGMSDGRDSFIGGPGKDKIDAKDFTKDKKIDCGSGNDKVKHDSFDPKPKSC